MATEAWISSESYTDQVNNDTGIKNSYLIKLNKRVDTIKIERYNLI